MHYNRLLALASLIGLSFWAVVCCIVIITFGLSNCLLVLISEFIDYVFLDPATNYCNWFQSLTPEDFKEYFNLEKR
jgi:hypothetical protein